MWNEMKEKFIKIYYGKESTKIFHSFLDNYFQFLMVEKYNLWLSKIRK